MERKILNIGLFGFGCVGEGLHQVLEQTPALKASIKKICIKHPDKKRSLPAELFTTSADELLNDPEINVIVELIDDADAAYTIVTRALRSGKPVVTANKKMLATHFNELLNLQREFNVPLLYEGACCASIPVIRNLEEYYDTDLVSSVEGIVNGSTNYILSKMETENISFPEALAQAQEKGYAESDASLDVEGLDAGYKLLLLVAHGFGLVLNPAQVFKIGISRLGTLERNYAREKGLRIRLVAHAGRTSNGNIRTFVMPAFVKPSDLLYEVNDVYNGIKIKSAFSDSQFFLGKGAGAHPTGSAVLSDLSALSYNYRYEYKKRNTTDIREEDDQVILKVLLSAAPADIARLGIYFLRIEESFSASHGAYLRGDINLRELKSLVLRYPSASPVLIGILQEVPANPAELCFSLPLAAEQHT